MDGSVRNVCHALDGRSTAVHAMICRCRVHHVRSGCSRILVNLLLIDRKTGDLKRESERERGIEKERKRERSIMRGEVKAEGDCERQSETRTHLETNTPTIQSGGATCWW